MTSTTVAKDIETIRAFRNSPALAVAYHATACNPYVNSNSIVIDIYHVVQLFNSTITR